MVYNGTIGPKQKTLVEGIVVIVKEPRRKKPLNKTSIRVETHNHGTINMNVPNGIFKEGNMFKETMTLGSLGILFTTK